MKQLRLKSNLTQLAFAEKIGWFQSLLADIEARKKNPGFQKLKKLVQATNISLDWLLFGENQQFYDAKGNIYKSRTQNKIIMLPILSQKVAAGPGQEFLDESEQIGALPVLESMISRYPRERLRVVKVKGDSMTAANLYNGDLVIFVQSLIEGDGIYVISIYGEVLVKRLEYDQVEQKVTVVSQNPEFPTRKVISADNDILKIEGKVIGWFHNHPY